MKDKYWLCDIYVSLRSIVDLKPAVCDLVTMATVTFENDAKKTLRLVD